MFRAFQTTAVLAMLLSATTVIADDKANSADMKKLQGVWAPGDGADFAPSVTIKGNKFTMEFDGEKMESTFTIDASKTPKTMDVTITGGSDDDEIKKYIGKIAKAIYAFDGDKLKWAAVEPGTDARPTKFGEEDGDEDDVLTLTLVRKK